MSPVANSWGVGRQGNSHRKSSLQLFLHAAWLEQQTTPFMAFTLRIFGKPFFNLCSEEYRHVLGGLNIAGDTSTWKHSIVVRVADALPIAVCVVVQALRRKGIEFQHLQGGAWLGTEILLVFERHVMCSVCLGLVLCAGRSWCRQCSSPPWSY